MCSAIQAGVTAIHVLLESYPVTPITAELDLLLRAAEHEKVLGILLTTPSPHVGPAAGCCWQHEKQLQQPHGA